MSVKKSILDGRLLPGKSVLIPGLILDQRLWRNDMPLGPKMNTFGSGNWMEMCQVIGPGSLFFCSSHWETVCDGEKSVPLEWSKSLRASRISTSALMSTLHSIVVRLVQMHYSSAKMHLSIVRVSCVLPWSKGWRIAYPKTKQGTLLFVSKVQWKDKGDAILIKEMMCFFIRNSRESSIICVHQLKSKSAS